MRVSRNGEPLNRIFTGKNVEPNLLIEVAKYLSNKDILELSLVNRHCNAILDDSFAYHEVFSSKQHLSLDEIFAIQKQGLKFGREYSIPQIIQECRNLESFTLDFNQLPNGITPDILPANLKAICLKNLNGAVDLSRFTNLQSVNIHAASHHINQILESVPEGVQKIVLDYYQSFVLNPPLTLLDLTRFEELRDLKIKANFQVGNLLLSHPNQLRSLHLLGVGDFPRVRYDDLRSLTLDLALYPQPFDFNLTPNLETCTLYNVCHVPDAIYNLQKIKSLSLGFGRVRSAFDYTKFPLLENLKLVSAGINKLTLPVQLKNLSICFERQLTSLQIPEGSQIKNINISDSAIGLLNLTHAGHLEKIWIVRENPFPLDLWKREQMMVYTKKPLPLLREVRFDYMNVMKYSLENLFKYAPIESFSCLAPPDDLEVFMVPQKKKRTWVVLSAFGLFAVISAISYRMRWDL